MVYFCPEGGGERGRVTEGGEEREGPTELHWQPKAVWGEGKGSVGLQKGLK